MWSKTPLSFTGRFFQFRRNLRRSNTIFFFRNDPRCFLRFASNCLNRPGWWRCPFYRNVQFVLSDAGTFRNQLRQSRDLLADQNWLRLSLVPRRFLKINHNIIWNLLNCKKLTSRQHIGGNQHFFFACSESIQYIDSLTDSQISGQNGNSVTVFCHFFRQPRCSSSSLSPKKTLILL